MKYAILGPRGGINRISETEPQHVPEGRTIIEISDEQAATVQEGLELVPRLFYTYQDGELILFKDWLRNHRWSEDAGEWVEFVPSVPQSVTPRQIRLALIDRGIMPEDITAQLSAIEDSVLRAKALAEWEFARDVKRSHPLIAQLAGALQFTDDDVDEIFREAEALGH
jgi:hypothetical protein